MKELLDDKAFVIMAVTILGALSIFFIDNASDIIQAIITGLFGIATGLKLAQKGEK